MSPNTERIPLCRACGTLVRADFPETVKAHAQYSDEIAALAVQTQHHSRGSPGRIFSDLTRSGSPRRRGQSDRKKG
ncbi:hypothetical protein [Tateyamaria sp.]|uniref:hypothetical protein n=1 Tax=Tateyamaria sp. TaxID=1929288 RepID=UPI003B2155AC